MFKKGWMHLSRMLRTNKFILLKESETEILLCRRGINLEIYWKLRKGLNINNLLKEIIL